MRTLECGALGLAGDCEPNVAYDLPSARTGPVRMDALGAFVPRWHSCLLETVAGGRKFGELSTAGASARAVRNAAMDALRGSTGLLPICRRRRIAPVQHHPLLVTSRGASRAWLEPAE